MITNSHAGAGSWGLPLRFVLTQVTYFHLIADPFQHAEILSHIQNLGDGSRHYTLNTNVHNVKLRARHWGEAKERPQPITPLNPTSNVTTNNQAPSITPMHVEVRAVDEAFVMENYSRLEPLMRRRMRGLRLQGVATRLNYSSKDVDGEREMEAPSGFQPRPSIITEEPNMGNIPPLLSSHIR
uniref:Uncharacterized protein n=1 Tax=Tanacetum cinerariifolium TaxID=118510 RepID=A0A699IFD4_TANCI|nr:hypothetical protein [Tanacetum cinerariifolium]